MGPGVYISDEFLGIDAWSQKTLTCKDRKHAFEKMPYQKTLYSLSCLGETCIVTSPSPNAGRLVRDSIYFIAVSFLNTILMSEGVGGYLYPSGDRVGNKHKT